MTRTAAIDEWIRWYEEDPTQERAERAEREIALISKRYARDTAHHPLQAP